MTADSDIADSSSLGGQASKACVAARRAVNRLTAHFALAWLAALVLAAAPAQAQDDDVTTIVAFGDSLTAGFGLPVEDGFVPQLEAWLHANGHPEARVINAGVSGDTTSGGLARLDWSLAAETDAVILELGANDMLRGVDPSIARDNLDAMLTRLGERELPVLLAGMRALGNWGEGYVEEFEAIYPELAEKHGAALYPFMLEGLAADASLTQPDRLHPNAEGVAVMVAAIGPYVSDLIATAEAAQ